MVAIESPIVNEEVVAAEVVKATKASAKKPVAKKAEAPKASAKKASAKPTKAPVASAPTPAPSAKKGTKKTSVAPTASAPSPTKKASAKASKATKEKAESSSVTVGEVKLSKAKVRILMALSLNGQLTRTQLAESTGITSGYCSLVGHADPSKVEEGSLIGLGMVKPIHLEGSPLAYELTAKGKKVVEKLPA